MKPKVEANHETRQASPIPFSCYFLSFLLYRSLVGLLKDSILLIPKQLRTQPNSYPTISTLNPSHTHHLRAQFCS